MLSGLFGPLQFAVRVSAVRVTVVLSVPRLLTLAAARPWGRAHVTAPMQWRRVVVVTCRYTNTILIQGLSQKIRKVIWGIFFIFCIFFSVWSCPISSPSYHMILELPPMLGVLWSTAASCWTVANSVIEQLNMFAGEHLSPTVSCQLTNAHAG